MVNTVFLDRDGVINELVLRNTPDYPAQFYTAPWKDHEFKFIDGAILAICKLKSIGMRVIVATNQPDVNDGHMSIETLHKFNQKLIDIGVDDVACALDRTSTDYKPGNGMLESMIAKYNIDRKHAFFVGDRWKDIVAGHRSGLRTIYCSEAPYNSPMEYKNSRVLPTFTVKNLLSASILIEDIKYD